MYPEIRHKAIPCLAFMKEAECVLYVGPVIYLPEVVQGISKEVFEYNFPGVVWPGEISAEMRLNEERQLSSPDSEWPLTRTSNESDRTLFLRRMMAALVFLSAIRKRYVFLTLGRCS